MATDGLLSQKKKIPDAMPDKMATELAQFPMLCL